MTDQLGLADADKQIILQNYFKDSSTNFIIKSTSVANFQEQRTGYLGDHHLLSIVIDQDGEDREITFFAKQLPTRIPKLAECLVKLKVFSKEAALFRELLPKLAEYGRFAPECLFLKGDDLLVFKNVKSDGFQVLDRDDGELDMAYLRQVLRTLARLHAASFALEAGLGKSLVEAFPGVLDENCWPDEENHPRNVELEAITKTLCAFIERHERPTSRREDLLRKIPNCVRQVVQLVKSSTVYRNALSHSDLWNNNLLFRHTDTSGVLVECLLVDFQLSRYVPPAYDFCMLLALTTTKDFRDEFLTSLQDFYYRWLSTELDRHGLNVEQILSQDEFRKSCKLYQKAAAIDSFTINHATLLPRRFLDEVYSSVEQFERFSPKMKTEKCLQMFDGDMGYRARIVDIIESVYEEFELV